MKVVFLSNFFNHHQRPFSEEMERLTKGQYFFIETTEMSEERKKMGWGMKDYPPYVLRNFENEEQRIYCQKLIDEADVVIIGSAPNALIKNRLRNKKLTFYYSERIYKQKQCDWYKYPIRVLRHFYKFARHKNLYMLCASAYTAADYAKTFCFIDKSYKWGYFPATKEYEDVGSLIEKKKKNSIAWVARLIALKHPELPILLAKRLKEEGYSFEMKLVGSGEMMQEIDTLIATYGLQDFVRLLGTMQPEQVREIMEESEIFLFTSDRNEGWGAVLNEAMNSGCVVVASHAIGSVPFMIKDKKSGLVYKDGDFENLFEKVKLLLDDKATCKRLARNAYESIVLEWNAEMAAKRLLDMMARMLDGEQKADIFEDGPCSKAKRIKDNWYNG